MSEKQFDIFDDAFRKASEQYEPAFNEDAWQKMEAKLDGKPKRRPAAWFWWLTDAIVISLMITMVAELNSGRKLRMANNIPTAKTITTHAKPGTLSQDITATGLSQKNETAAQEKPDAPVPAVAHLETDQS